MQHTLQLYTPHDIQRKFHSSKCRYRVFVAGRQCGKSSACLNELLAHAWPKPNTTYWFVSPTYSQAKIQYRRTVGMLWKCRAIILKNSQTEHRIKLINGSEIFFKSADVYENLRGATLHGCVLDEVREMPPEVWTMVIQPMLATTGGWAAFVSTPSGFDLFYDLAERARLDTTGTWELFRAPSTANPLFSQEEFERLKAEMPEQQFRQEILAEFVSLTSGNAYKNFTQENVKDQNPFAVTGQPINQWLPVVLAPDFNLDPMAWGLGQNKGADWYWFDEIYLRGSHTQEASQELVSRLSVLRDQGLMKSNPQIIVCGDATAKAGQRAAAGRSDYDILLSTLSAAGFTWDNRTPDSNPMVKDRVNAVNAKLRSADGSIHMWANSIHCPSLIRDLQRVVWKPNSTTLDQTSDSTLTHSSDGPGYAVTEITPIQSVADVGTLRIIRR